MMKKFMAMYMAPPDVVAEMMKATPEQMKAGMDDWMKWGDAHKKELVEMGAPLGKTKRVSMSGMSDAKNDITGYSIVEAASFDDAAKIFKNHPHLKMMGTSIDILECMDMAAMMK